MFTTGMSVLEIAEPILRDKVIPGNSFTHFEIVGVCFSLGRVSLKFSLPVQILPWIHLIDVKLLSWDFRCNLDVAEI